MEDDIQPQDEADFLDQSCSHGIREFPKDAQDDVLTAWTIAADGGFPGNVKPMKGLGTGVYEVTLRHRTDAYRAVYTLQFEGALWVVHTFQK